MKTLKWMLFSVALAMLTVFAVNGSFGDDSADGKYLTIVQSELERDGGSLCSVARERELLPITEASLQTERVLLQESFAVTDRRGNAGTVNVSVVADLYLAENGLDHMVFVTNTGNADGYVRTWFVFEMGSLTAEEFQAAVLLNRNTTQWTWGEFTYGVMINGARYAVVCATYREILIASKTSAPSLLQILLQGNVSSDLAYRMDGTRDGLFEVGVYSQVVSDEGAWSQITDEPWNKPSPTE